MEPNTSTGYQGTEAANSTLANSAIMQGVALEHEEDSLLEFLDAETGRGRPKPRHPLAAALFGRGSNSRSNDGHRTRSSAASEVSASGDVDEDPLYPSLNKELPRVPLPELYRPSWDPRERWRQGRPTQPYYAPPESDLPDQFRYEDLSAYENLPETMDTHQDRLLCWLMERFERGMRFKSTGETSQLTADQAIREQVFTQQELLDEQLSSLGPAASSSANPALQERRRQLVAMATEEEQRRKELAAAKAQLEGDDGEEDEEDEDTETETDGDQEVDEFGEFVGSSLVTRSEVSTRVCSTSVVLVHEEPESSVATTPVPAQQDQQQTRRGKQYWGRQPAATRKKPRHTPAFGMGVGGPGGDVASGGTLQYEVSLSDSPWQQQQHQRQRQHRRSGRPQQFGDAPSHSDDPTWTGTPNTAEDAV